MKRITLGKLQQMKEEGEPIVMLTAYSTWQAKLADAAGAEMLLVGDSLGMVEQGLEDTVGVTEEMIHMASAAVMRARPRAFVVGDMPFLSYEVDTREAVRNAGRLVKQTGVDAVKIEGGVNRAETIRALVNAGIPVVGHVGLTPQSSTLLGGYRVQGKDAGRAREVLDDALAVDRAGASVLVMECIPAPLAERITAECAIPTIGIGAGVGCDGQVLVFHDVLGLYSGGVSPRFVKRYLDGASVLGEALTAYRAEVKDRSFPADEHSYGMDPEILDGLERRSS
ncbi:MAG: 3-methyl-2-oxobutanoate hydroxymethyltransferase [Synergistales bacterium]|nr:3-methyl-2-oxobutanoate hydroxymethyltransferase [Synergistales bacterium]